MTENQDPHGTDGGTPSDAEIKYNALMERFEELRKENAELKHSVAKLELEKPMPNEDPKKEPEEKDETLDDLVDESVARIRGDKK